MQVKTSVQICIIRLIRRDGCDSRKTTGFGNFAEKNIPGADTEEQVVIGSSHRMARELEEGTHQAARRTRLPIP